MQGVGSREKGKGVTTYVPVHTLSRAGPVVGGERAVVRLQISSANYVVINCANYFSFSALRSVHSMRSALPCLNWLAAPPLGTPTRPYAAHSALFSLLFAFHFQFHTFHFASFACRILVCPTLVSFSHSSSLFPHSPSFAAHFNSRFVFESFALLSAHRFLRFARHFTCLAYPARLSPND